jgi:hypothetical protein
MTETQSFLIDMLLLVPDGAICFIQAPSIDDSSILGLWQPSEYPYYQQVLLTAENKQRLINIVKTEGVEQDFHSLEIKQANQLLFKADDGMEMGVVSKNFVLPASFIDKYAKTYEMCVIADSW